MKCMYKNPHCFGAACDSHSFGRRRRGGRRSPARNLRTPPRGPTFHNLPGATNQKIIAMGFDLGNGFPDMKGYRKFLMGMKNAGFGMGNPFMANGLLLGNGWETNQKRFEQATEILYDYTDPDSWKLGPQSNNPNRASPYRMQDVAILKKSNPNFCTQNNMCRELVGPFQRELAMPWSYVAIVQPGGKLRRRTRRGMINFLRDYSKYATAQRLAILGPPTSLESPIRATTKSLNPLQRKLQRNTFKRTR